MPQSIILQFVFTLIRYSIVFFFCFFNENKLRKSIERSRYFKNQDFLSNFQMIAIMFFFNNHVGIYFLYNISIICSQLILNLSLNYRKRKNVFNQGRKPNLNVYKYVRRCFVKYNYFSPLEPLNYTAIGNFSVVL